MKTKNAQKIKTELIKKFKKQHAEAHKHLRYMPKIKITKYTTNKQHAEIEITFKESESNLMTDSEYRVLKDVVEKYETTLCMNINFHMDRIEVY